MKLRILLFGLVLLGLSTTGYSQNFSKLKSIELIERKDYTKAENKVLECCKFILKTPLNKDNESRKNALQFLFRWMDGTPDYTFELDEAVARLASINQDLIGPYMAAMTQYVLEHKGKDDARNKARIKQNAIKSTIDYLGNPKNGVEMNDAIRQWMQNNNEDGPMQAI